MPITGLEWFALKLKSFVYRVNHKCLMCPNYILERVPMRERYCSTACGERSDAIDEIWESNNII